MSTTAIRVGHDATHPVRVDVAWFAILFTGTSPRGLRNLLVPYLR